MAIPFHSDIQLNGTLTVGVDDTGHDVKFFGATSGSYMLWDESQDRLEFVDNVKITFGTNADYQIYHNGTTSLISNYTGDLQISNYADDRDIIFQSDDGSGGTTPYLTIDGSAGYTQAYKNIRYRDNVKADFGDGGDLDIYHDGSNSYISQGTTGDLYIRQTRDDGDIFFQCDNGTGSITTYFSLDGSLADGTYFYTKWPDNSIIALGSSNDLLLWHDASNSYIRQVGTGDLIIENITDDKDIIFKSDNGSGGTTEYFRLDGALGYSIANKHILFEDSVKARFGSSADLEIQHDGSHSYISQGGTGNLYIQQNTNDQDLVLQCDDGAGGTTPYITLDGSEEKVVVNKPSQRTFTKSGTTDGDANGDIVYFGGTTSMEVGAIYYLTASGTWALADADAESTAKGMLAVALGASSDTNGMLVRGFVTLNHDPGTVGDTLFLSTTAGLASSTAPSGNGDIVRVIGYCLDSTNGQIYFNPDGTFVEVSA